MQVRRTPPPAGSAAGLLDWADPTVGRLVDEVAASALVIAASPTYKASHTGLLKLFLDRFSTDSLRGAVGVPLMLGAGPAHQLAAEHALRPLLTELGASVTTSGLYLLEREYDAPDAFDAWLDRNRRALACTGLPIPFPTGAPA